MKLILGSEITNEWLTNSNVAENDYPEWDAGTEYSVDDHVMITGTTHLVWRCIQDNNTGNIPTIDEADTWWALVGATNRWKAFDEYLADKVSNAGTITYEFTVPASTNVDRVAVFGPTGSTVTVSVVNASETEIYSESYSLADPDMVYDWLQFWKQGDKFRYRNECIFEDVPGSPGYVISVTIDAGAETAEVGQIIIGRGYDLGVVVNGTELSIEDYSDITRNQFGRPSITRRDYAKLVDYEVVYATDEGNRLLRLLGELRGIPTVFYDSIGTDQMGTTTYGIYRRFKFGKRAAGSSTGRIEVAGYT